VAGTKLNGDAKIGEYDARVTTAIDAQHMSMTPRGLHETRAGFMRLIA
jgi:hypothetical protein